MSSWNDYDKYGLKAFSLADCQDMTEEDAGVRIHFDQSMRTKNSRKLLSKTVCIPWQYTNRPIGVLLIWHKKSLFFIDPRWITIDTAFSVFLSGTTSRIAGLGVIKQVTEEYIIATPLVIGTIHMVNPGDFIGLIDREIPAL